MALPRRSGLSHVRLLLAGVAVLDVLFPLATALAADTGIWPVYDVVDGKRGEANRGVLQGFGDGSINSQFFKGFHEGLDIRGSGKGGEEVAAFRGGALLARDQDDAGGSVYIRVNVGTGENPAYETDVYSHVAISTDVAIGTEIAQGAKLGTISATVFTEVNGTQSAHLHLQVCDGTCTLNGGAVGPPDKPFINTTSTLSVKSLRSPLARMAAVADRDPGNVRPALADTNKDGQSILVVQAGTHEALPGKTVQGAVDIIADVRDNMNPDLLGGAGPKKVGYYIKALFDKGVPKHDVQDPKSPYVLADFRDETFGDDFTQGQLNSLKSTIYANDAAYRVTTDAMTAGHNNTIFELTKHYVVTNATGSLGYLTQADQGQFWNTRAELDAMRADDGYKSNMADGVFRARKNADAHFKDGDYEIHIVAGDLVGKADLNGGKVRVDNFVQKAEPKKNGAAPMANPGPGAVGSLYEGNSPFAAGYALEAPESAVINFSFTPGELVAVSGEEFYPDLVIPVYILPHRSAWLDGDDIVPDFTGYVLADAGGFIPDTMTGYQAFGYGLFDMILDYDRDGHFSATLDALTGFSVVPVPLPASVIFLFPALGLLATRRRRSGTRYA